MSEPIHKVDYGNWVSKKFIYIPALLAVIFLGLSFLSLLFLVGTFLFLIPTAYFVYAYFQFSPRGGKLQAKIRDLVFNQLVWDGDGRLLDIGCGNGALAIEAAQKYPKAQITGIDYWGGQWEYSKQACEKNAEIAGVAERTFFQKASASKLPFTDEFFDATVSNFVFHEVQDVKDKKEVIKEALRVLKKGGLFVFQDLFLLTRMYGEPQDLLSTIKKWGIQDIKFVNTSDQKFIPRAMKLPFMVGQIGVICGRK
jgi:ubiquinone/menaquinone biosynthesis C-methylase UbiE